MKFKFLFDYRYGILFWFSLWVIQSVLMSSESELEFYLVKNIAIVGLQFIIVFINYKWLFPVFLERKRYVSYILLSIIIIYSVFTLSFPLMDIVFSIVYPDFITQGSVVFPLGFWRILSGSSFYSLALVCSLVYFLLKKNQKNENANLVLKKRLSENQNTTVIIKEGRKTHRVLKEDIHYIKGLKEYVVWHTKNKNIITLQTMSSIEHEHKAIDFLRVHKSYIVNMKHVSSFEKNLLKVKNETIPVGRTYKENIKVYMECQSIIP